MAHSPLTREIRWQELTAGEEALVNSLQQLNATLRKIAFILEESNNQGKTIINS